MVIQQSGSERTILFITAITAWFALGLQLHLFVNSSDQSLTVTISRYFRYFTIWTNLVTAICCTISLFPGRYRLYSFFRNPACIAAIALYILAVAVVYNFLLRNLWDPEGMSRVADELLHLVVPALFLVYWIFFTPKSKLSWNHIFLWLIYPVVYLVFALACGIVEHFYPYPFLDIGKHGLNAVLLNCLLLLFGLVICAALFVAVGKLSGRKTEGNFS